LGINFDMYIHCNWRINCNWVNRLMMGYVVRTREANLTVRVEGCVAALGGLVRGQLGVHVLDKRLTGSTGNMPQQR